MRKITFPNPFRHDHKAIRNPHEEFEAKLSFAERLADHIAAVAGSWPFILTQTTLLCGWIFFNVTALIYHWDPYPFILLNLVLSLQAAYTAPMIMISQNRQAARDRYTANNDYEINLKSEMEIRVILEHLDAQNTALSEILRLLQEKQRATVESPSTPDK